MVLKEHDDFVKNVSQGVSSKGLFVKADAVYLNGRQIEGADAATFRLLDSKIEDPGFLEFVYVDKNHVYVPSVLEGADPATFKRIFDTQGKATTFFRDRRSVYYNFKVIPNVDEDSFQPVVSQTGQSTMFATDKDSVFYGTKRIDGIDLMSLKVIDHATIEDKSFVYKFSHNNVIENDQIVFSIQKLAKR